MKLIQLQYFQTVCKYLNITRAAEELYVSQPAISSSIRELEKELEVQLFLRHNNRLYLTKEGQILQKQTSHILREIAKLKHVLSEESVQQSSIVLGLPPILYSYFLPYLLQIRAVFNERHSSVKLHLHEVPLPQLEQGLQDGSLDLAVAHVNPQSFSAMEKEVFYSAQVKLCVKRSHPLAHCEAVSPDDFSGERILTCFKGDAVVAQAIDAWFEAQSWKPKACSPYQQSQAVESLLALSTDVALLCPEVCMFSSQIVGVPLKKPLYLDFGIVWNSEHPLSNAVLEIMDDVRAIGKQMKEKAV